MRTLIRFVLDPSSHPVDFVLNKISPVFAVAIAFLAVEMIRFVDFVSLHLLDSVEGLIASLFVALNGLDELQWWCHVGDSVGDLVLKSVLVRAAGELWSSLGWFE